jgi:hypothetical protein
MRPTDLARLAALAASAALLAACQTTNPGATAQASAPAPVVMTHTRAAAECWMQTEKTALKMDLDRRADLVDACIDKKMHGHPG